MSFRDPEQFILLKKGKMCWRAENLDQSIGQKNHKNICRILELS